MSNYRSTLEGKEVEVAEKQHVINNFQNELQRSRVELDVEKDAQRKGE